MLTSYVKIMWRHLIINKWYSFIRIISLTIGLSVFTLIFAYLTFELSFDSFHKNAKNIYRVIAKVPESYMGRNQVAVTPGTVAPAMKKEIPEVIRATRIEYKNVVIDNGRELISESGFLCVDPDFLQMFSFQLIKGDTSNALKQSYTLFITESMAKKYFGSNEPLGQILRIDKALYTIAGILKDPPGNTQIPFNFISSFLTTIAINGEEANASWNDWEYYTFAQFMPNSDVAAVNEKLAALKKKYNEKGNQTLILQPLIKMRLHTMANFEMSPPTDPKMLKVLVAVGLLILIIAGFNYINLSTAKALNRAKEIGLRKVAGAKKTDLVFQLLGESIAFSLIALVIAATIAHLALPLFGNYLKLPLEGKLVFNIRFLCELAILTFVFGILSGIYPAVYISSIQPITIFKSERKALKDSLVRNALVVCQLILSVLLIFVSIVVNRQVKFMKNKDMGFDKDHIIGVRFYDRKANLLKAEFEGIGSILDMTVSNQLPANIGKADFGFWDEMQTEKEKLIYRIYVDRHFLDFYKIPVMQSMSANVDLIKSNNYLVNQSAVKRIGWDDPIGKKFGFNKENMGIVVGIVKDFNFASLRLGIEPLAISFFDEKDGLERGWLSLKVSPDNLDETIKSIKSKWEKIIPDEAFSYAFLEDKVEEKYHPEMRLRTSFLIFTIITVFIACLGLYGLVSFMVERRRKEIGIRKVMGAGFKQIILLQTIQFLKLIFISLAIALPSGYFFMHTWLNDFAYRIDIGWQIYTIPAVMIVLISLITIGYQTLKSSLANPVDILKYE